MTRLARRISLLVTFYLLTSAATAYAECTWVLWITGTRQPNPLAVTGLTVQFTCLPDTIDPRGTKAR